jgi:peptidoglycan/LPS O-acetylase OafA/YrhL
VAVLAVVFYHFAPDVAPGGFLGVDLFFVLSGFLITTLLVKEWDVAQRIALSSFWVRRARRLLPALILVLGVVGVSSLIFPDPVDAHRFGLDGLSSLAYIANWHFIDSGQAYIDQFLHQATSPLRHMWSLAIEEQFYLLWPLLVVGVAKLVGRRGGTLAPARRRTFRRALMALCIVLGVLSFVRMITLFASGGDLNRVYYGTDSRAFVILIGAALAVLTFGVPAVPRARRGAVVVIGTGGAIALVVAMASLTVESSWLYEGGYGLVAIAMALVLLAAAQPGFNPLARLLSLRALVGLGLISYGVYLWHWPVSLWITEGRTGIGEPWLFLVRSVVTLAVSLASYALLEQPIRTGKLRFGFRPGTVAAAGVVVAVVVVLVVPAVAFPSVRTAPTTAAPAAEVVDVQAGYAAAPRCDGGATPATRIDPDRRLVVQFEGNSLAGEMRDCLRKIMRPRGVRFATVNPPDFLLCNELPAIREQVQKTRPDAGLLFAFVAYDPRCGEPWHRSVDDLIAIWKDAGMHVFLVPSPGFITGTQEAANLSTGPDQESIYYGALAAQDPEHITVLDAGSFVRTDTGEYVWRMPCLPGGEPGCDANDTVGVRYIDGLHFCTDPEFSGHGCVGEQHMGGQRRGASSIAAGLIPGLEALVARSSAPAASG